MTQSLPDIVKLFNKVNIDCANGAADEQEQVVLFSSEPDIVEFYMEQMENLEYSQDEMDEFRNFLESMPA